MGNELSIVNQNEIGIMDLGNVLAKSGYFSDARDAAQAIVKVLAGRELGFGPIASMTGFYIVKGKISMSANLMGAAVKRSGKYDYKVTRIDNEGCAIAFYEAGKQIGESTLTIAEAKAAKMDQEWDKDTKAWKPKFTWQNFPRNMLFARTMSNGVKWFCPDVTGGPVYTPEELGEVVDGETGEVVKPDHGPQWTGLTPTAQAYQQGVHDAEWINSPEKAGVPANVIPKSWPTEAIDWAVSEWGVKSFAVTGALKQSKVLTFNDSAETVKHWLAIRKVERDNGVDGVEATARADADLQATRESAA